MLRDMDNATRQHTHRQSDGFTVHAMQYKDLTVCGQYAPTDVWVEHTEEIIFGTGFRKCVACSVAK
jgi:hypothetical protein